LAGSGYVVLAMSGQLLSPSAFAAATSFYLLLNTVGRGLCAAIELHLTRVVAHDLARGRGLRAARRVGARQTAVLLTVAVAVVAVGSPVITNKRRPTAESTAATTSRETAATGVATWCGRWWCWVGPKACETWRRPHRRSRPASPRWL